MFSQLPFKKDYMLIVASVCLLIISYKLAFEQTVEAWAVNSRLKTQLTQSANLRYQPNYLKRKSANQDIVINLYKADTIAFRTNSISSISIIATKENVRLIEVPMPDPVFNTDKFIVQKLDFDGDFFALTKVLNQLQQKKGIGIIRSFSYKLTGSTVNENKKLVLEVCFEIKK